MLIFKKVTCILLLTGLLIFVISFSLSNNDGGLENGYKRKKDKNQKLVVLFSISPTRCENSDGDEIFMQSYANRLMWAKLKGYDVVFNRGRPDKRLSGPYSKVALTRAVLANESALSEDSPDRHEWLLWIDADALINNMIFEIPFHKYTNADFVVYGEEKYTYEEIDGVKGINSGVYLLRNTEWLIAFITL